MKTRPTFKSLLARAATMMLMLIVMTTTAGAQDVTSYDLWLGLTQVTSANKDDILNETKNGQPTAKYDPATSTLTLNEPTITSMSRPLDFDTAIRAKIASKSDLTIAGSYTLNEPNAECCIYLTAGSLTLAGDFMFCANRDKSIYLQYGDLVVQSGTLCFVGAAECTYTSFVVRDGVEYVEFEGEAVDEDDVELPEGYEIEGIENSYVIHKSGVTYYPLRLGRTFVTSQNKDNILNQTGENDQPTAKYNPETNTLTLNNPSIAGTNLFSRYEVNGSYETIDAKIACWFSDNLPFTIAGSYHMTENERATCGIASGIPLSFDGDFTLYGSKMGVYTSRNLTLDSGSFKAIGGDYGLLCCDLFIENSSSEFTGGEKAFDCRDLQIVYSAVLVTPEYGRVEGNQCYEADGTTISKHVLIQDREVAPYRIWLGDTEVTPNNKDNILNQLDAKGNPTARYEPGSYELTLSNPTITGVHTFGPDNESTAEIYSHYEIIINGTYHQTKATAQYGLYHFSGLYFDGEYTFRGTDYGLCAKAVGFRRTDNILTLSGQAGAMYCPAYSFLGNSITLPQGEKGRYRSPNIEDSNGQIATEAVLHASVNFLYLGDTQVEPDNCNDILGDGTGSASFDPDTNILTLDNPLVPGSYETLITDVPLQPMYSSGCILYGEALDLTVKGQYHITDEDKLGHGIVFRHGSLTLDGDFTILGNRGGIYVSDGDLTLDWSNSNVRIYADKYSVPSKSITLAKAFVDQDGTFYASGNVEQELLGGKTLTPAYDIRLKDNDDNSAAMAADYLDGVPQFVTLDGRTLYKDGNWNTLCLPFDMTVSQVAAQLAPDALMTLKTSDFSDGVLTLTFEDAASISAGVPYIIKWDGDGTDNLVNPTFTGVTIVNATTPVMTAYVNFIGTYSPADIFTTRKTNLYLGGAGTLYYPWGDNMSSFTVNAFRGYFQLKNGLVCGEPDPNGGGAGSIVLRFGEGTNGIEVISSPPSQTLNPTSWFTPDGRKLTDKPTAKGIYITNGKKVVIK